MLSKRAEVRKESRRGKRKKQTSIAGDSLFYTRAFRANEDIDADC